MPSFGVGNVQVRYEPKPAVDVSDSLNYVSVLDYGAVADFVTDNTAAIEAARAAARAAGHNRTYFPGSPTGGGFLTTGHTLIEKEEWLGDHGNTYGGYDATYTSLVQLANGAESHLLLIPSGAGTQKITRMQLDGNKAGQAGQWDVIHIADTANPAGEEWQGVIAQSMVRNGKRHGVYVGNLRRGGLIDSTIVYQNGLVSGNYGLYVIGSDTEIRKANINENYAGLFVATTVTRVIGCDIGVNVTDGLVTSNDATDNLFLGNGIDRNGRHGCFIDGGNGNVFTGNIWHSNSQNANAAASHVVLSGNVTDTSFLANTFGQLDPGVTNSVDICIRALNPANTRITFLSNVIDPTTSNFGVTYTAEIFQKKGTDVGVVAIYGGVGVPPGFLECNGQTVSRVTYEFLFRVIGSTFGGGDGFTTFEVPNIPSPGAGLKYVVSATL